MKCNLKMVTNYKLDMLFYVDVMHIIEFKWSCISSIDDL